MAFTHTLNPVLLHLGPVQIHWYGLMWALAFLITWAWVRRLARRKEIPLSVEEAENMTFTVVLGVVLGARLGHALIYNPWYFAASPLKLLAVWEGGLSFHGGLIGGFLAGAWYARKRGWSVLQMLDTFIVPITLGLALGRIGNFINGELYGNPTDLWWGVVFPGVEGARHPSQLYEAAYSLIIFACLLAIRRIKRLPRGALIAAFMTLYAVFRSITEAFRSTDGYTGAASIFSAPSGYIGPLTIGQALNIPVFLAGAALAVWLWRRRGQH